LGSDARNKEDISVCQRNNVWENQLGSTSRQLWGSEWYRYMKC